MCNDLVDQLLSEILIKLIWKQFSLCNSSVLFDFICFVVFYLFPVDASYQDPLVGASNTFLLRVNEISSLEAETVRQERYRKLKKKNKLDRDSSGYWQCIGTQRLWLPNQIHLATKTFWHKTGYWYNRFQLKKRICLDNDGQNWMCYETGYIRLEDCLFWERNGEEKKYIYKQLTTELCDYMNRWTFNEQKILKSSLITGYNVLHFYQKI